MSKAKRIILVGAATTGLAMVISGAANAQLYVNNSSDITCARITDITNVDDALAVTRDENCYSSTATTQTDHSLFYSTEGGYAENLSLGGTLNVNGGTIAVSDVAGNGSTRIGGGATTTTAAGEKALVLGTDASAAGDNAVAVGTGASATGASAVAVGTNTSATGTSAVAIGDGASATGNNSVALGAGSVADADNTVSVGSVGNERTITNLAKGEVSATSTQAINGSQLYETNQKIEQIGISAVTIDSNGDGSLRNSVTLQGGDPNAPVLLSNVAAGVADGDAVNVGQLNSKTAETLTSANKYTDAKAAETLTSANGYTDQKAGETLASAQSYTDSKLAELNSDISDIRTEARQAAAIGLAVASLRYDERPGKLSAAFGGGSWRGSEAMAIGVGYTSLDQSVRANLAASGVSGEWGVGVGVSFTFN